MINKLQQLLELTQSSCLMHTAIVNCFFHALCRWYLWCSDSDGLGCQTSFSTWSWEPVSGRHTGKRLKSVSIVLVSTTPHSCLVAFVNWIRKEMERQLFFHGEVLGAQNLTQLLKLKENHKSRRTRLSETAPVISCYHAENYGQFHFSYAHYFTRAPINPAGLWLASQCTDSSSGPQTPRTRGGRLLLPFLRARPRRGPTGRRRSPPPCNARRPPSCVPQAPGVISHPAALL